MFKIFEKKYGENEFKEKTYKLTLNLTKRQMDLLINSTSDLGKKDKDCLEVQSQILGAVLNTEYYKDIEIYNNIE